MTVDLIRYDLLVQDALRDVVRRVLADVARDGLPGDHHFFIGFKTTAPGVRLSSRLKERHPKDMTIVLQHEFWDLIVGDKSFEVNLSFNRVPEKLHIPYDALTGFYDPSVKFGLQFEPAAEDGAEEEAGEDAPSPVPAPVVAARPRATSVPATRAAEPRPSAARPVEPKSTDTKPVEVRPAAAKSAEPKSAEPKPALAKGGTSAGAAKEAASKEPSAKEPATKQPAAKESAAKDTAKEEGAGAQVLRLDSFRKK